jgi:zinc protease
MSQVHQLESGLRVAIDPGGPVPVVSVQLWFDVGSAREANSLAGAAHLLEHMLFKASAGNPAGQAVSRLEAAGGSINAWTSLEQTALYVTLPSSQLALAIEVLADMGTRPLLLEDELTPERGVVIEELRESLDDPGDVLAEALRARVYDDHPYGRPILGTEATVTALNSARLRGFHQPHYQPSNAILTVCGPVEPDVVLALAATHLGDGRARPARQIPAAASLPAQPGAFCLDPGFDERLIEVAVPIPPLDHADLPALDVLAVGMGEGGSALLPQVLRHQRDLCLSCWSMLENERAGGMLVSGLSAREGQLEDAVSALLEVIHDISRDGLPGGVVRRAKAAIRADRLRDRETVDGRASRLAWYVANRGDPAADLAYEASIQAVSVAEVRRVAGIYLDPRRWVVGVIAPAEELDDSRLQAAFAHGSAPRSQPVVVATERTTVARLKCGAKVLIEPDPQAEMLGVSVIGLGGAIAAGPRNAGLPTAWASLLTRGAGDMDAVTFAAAVEERAGSMRAWSARNSSGVQLAFPGPEVSSALDLLGDVLLRPRFSAEETQRTRIDLV